MRTVAFALVSSTCALTGLVALAPLGCTFEGSLPDDARVRCLESAQCAEGQACDVETQLCVAADAAPPAVVAVELPAAAAAGVVQLRIDANVPLEGAPALAWSPADPGFTFVRVEGASAFFSLAIDGGAPTDGFYTLSSARLTSAAGLERTVPLASTLRVDRVAPTGSLVFFHGDLEAQLLEDITGPFTERRARAEMFVAVTVSEPVDEASLDGRVEGVALLLSTCEIVEADLVVCAIVVGPENAGSLITIADVEVEIRDLAGNVTLVSAPAPFDFRPPAVVPGSVSAVLRSATGDGGARWSAGETLEISFVVDEAVVPPATLTTDGPLPLDFTLVSSVGRVLRYERALDVDPLTELVQPRVRLTDAFEHTDDALLELPAPFTGGVLVAELEPSPCSFEPDGTPACVDLDDDGALGFQAGVCEPANPDCDDEDPLRGPGFPEIAGDGVPNDCDGVADRPIDDAHGVFVNTALAGAGPGTQAAPMNSLLAALVEARAAGKTLYVAAGPTPSAISGELVVDVDVVGGLDPVTWAPGAAFHDVAINAGVALHLRDAAFAGLRFVGGGTVVVSGTRATVARCAFDNGGSLAVLAPATVVDITAGLVEVQEAAANVRFARVDVDAVASDAADLRISRSRVGAAVFENGASAVITNTLLTGAGSGQVVTCAACGEVALFHDVLTGVDEIALSVSAGGRVVLASSIVDMPANGSVLLRMPLDDGLFAFAENVVDVDHLLARGAFTPSGNGSTAVTAIDADAGSASESFFPGRTDLIVADPDLDPNDARRVLDTSPALGLGASFPLPGAPSTVAADFEGECRTVPIDAGTDSR